MLPVSLRKMARDCGIRVRPGKRSGEFVVELSPAWELRLRRVLRAQLAGQLPDPYEPGISAEERQARQRLRRQQIQSSICHFLSELVMADIVGREVALATRSHFGTRRGTLREQVECVLREIFERSVGGGPASSPLGSAPLLGVKRKG